MRALTTAWDAFLDTRLAELEEAGLARTLRPVDRPAAAVVERDGRRLVNLSSNDYLGLAGHPAVVAGEHAAAARGAGSTASRLVAGTDREVVELEARIAELEGTEAALVFGSGYLANLGLLSAALGRGDTVFSDRLNHASIWDGIRLSGATLHRYRHRDAEHLAWMLARAPEGGRLLIVTESVFSMDGDVAPLADIAELAERRGAALVVDEAHAGGVFGPRGEGYAHELGIEESVDLHVGTFGKAYGVAGAYVAGSRAWIRYLVSTCRPFMYTTALPPAVVGGIGAALDLVASAHELRASLAGKAARVRDRVAALGLDTCGSTTQIVPVLAGSSRRALALAQALEERGVLAVAIRPPTVPAGSARIRLSVCAHHADPDLERALAALDAAAHAVPDA